MHMYVYIYVYIYIYIYIHTEELHIIYNKLCYMGGGDSRMTIAFPRGQDRKYGQFSYFQFARIQIEGLKLSHNHCLRSLQNAL